MQHPFKAEDRGGSHCQLHVLDLVHFWDFEVSILILVHTAGPDQCKDVAGEIDVAGFVVDLPARLAEWNVRSQICGPLMLVPLIGASLYGVAFGTEIHTVWGRVDVDNAIVE